MASLYLPSLNADIIDNGVATGDTGYIMSTGGWMLRVTLLQIVCSVAAVYFGARAGDGLRPRRPRGALFHRVGEFSAREVGRFGAPSLITRNTNDVQQVQMLVLMTCTMLVAAPIMCVGGIIMAMQRGRRAVLADGGLRARAGRRDRARSSRGWCRSSGSCRCASTDQPGAARADHRHPGGARVRARAASRRERFARRQRRRHGDRAARGPADGADVPDRHARAQRVERRGAVVRRGPHRRRARCRSARSPRSSPTSCRS